MASKEDMEEQSEVTPRISTFAVLDLETSNLPAYNHNRVAITELCIYAFEAALLKQPKWKAEGDKDLQVIAPSPLRVMHKLNLLFQPSMMVHPEAERITGQFLINRQLTQQKFNCSIFHALGLSNYLLERESPFNENSAGLIISFLKHLPPPVCLVAHNGWAFDFPIVKQALNKVNMELPQSVTCVDSLRAFLEIDERRCPSKAAEIPCQNLLEVQPKDEAEPSHDIEETEPIRKTETTHDIQATKLISETEPAKEIDWRAVNESTPKRPILTPIQASVKRRQLADDDEDEEEQTPAKRKLQEIHSRRQLFTGLRCSEVKRFPPRGIYKLDNLFASRLNCPALSAHQAEADVTMLTSLIQHYGLDFLAFAEEQAIPFKQVTPLGAPVGQKR
ncbi:hypothetical protein KR009_001846 [Drosophila setifemur]|nr:hypothetical protein KR009_001846 [Drosophila setifemur]